MNEKDGGLKPTLLAMAQHFKVHELLNASELEELEQFAREPGRTIDELHEWLQARGFTMSRGAVGNWKAKFDERLTLERFSRSSELAQAMKAGFEKGGPTAISEAALVQLTQVVFEQAVRLQEDGSVKSGDLLNMTLALKTAVGTKQGIEKLKSEYETRQRQAVEAAEAAVKSGGSGAAVVAKVREILGMAA